MLFILLFLLAVLTDCKAVSHLFLFIHLLIEMKLGVEVPLLLLLVIEFRGIRVYGSVILSEVRSCFLRGNRSVEWCPSPSSLSRIPSSSL